MLRIQTIFAIVSLVATSIIASVYFIEHVLEYPPCVLCLWQRLPWFFIIIAALLGWRFARRNMPFSTHVMFTVICICLGASIALAGYHIGVEWAWWAGPDTCSGVGLNTSFDELKQTLLSQQPVRCDVVEFTVLGQSLALWNAVASLTTLLGVAALFGYTKYLQNRETH